MTTYYVATRARYVLVEATDEAEARRLGRPALQELHADVSARIGSELPIEIHVVRPATDDEIELMAWHRELLGQ
jgi:hypothetical protein